MAFVDSLAVVSTAFAAIATLSSVIVFVRSARQTSLARDIVRGVDLKMAIEDLDRPGLRHILYRELGSVRVSDYVSGPALRSRFDELIAEVAHFVAEPEEPEVRPGLVESVSLRPERQVPSDLIPAYQDLVSGDSWTALARVRRTLELTMSSMLGEGEVGTRKQGAGQLLRRLRSLGRLDEGWYRQLGYAISVCNAAVHGEDITPSQAAEVLDIVARWLETADR